MEEAQKENVQMLAQSILRDYQIPELQEIQRNARSLSHTSPDHQYSDEDC